MRGKFIVFEGSDGSGKTTVLEKVKEFLNESGINYIMTREPGGTKIGEQIREILLSVKNSEMDDRTEALLFAAARAQNVSENLKEEINKRDLIISDRYVTSSLAYQGYAKDLGIENIKNINDFAINGMQPDYIFFLDVDPVTVIERKRKNFEADRMEEKDNSYHQKVYDGYKKILRDEEKLIKIDASRNVDEVIKETIDKLKGVLDL